MHQLFLLSLAVLLLLNLGPVDSSCKYKGKQICEGAVTKVMKKSVRICTEGKVLKKKKEEVEPGYPMAGGGNLTFAEPKAFQFNVKDKDSKSKFLKMKSTLV